MYNITFKYYIQFVWLYPTRMMYCGLLVTFFGAVYKGYVQATEETTWMNFTGKFGNQNEKQYTIVMTKDTWFGAFAYCSDNKLGNLMQTGYLGSPFVYVRHQLFLRGWNRTDFLWTGMIKPKNGDILYKARQCLGVSDAIVSNVSTGVDQCIVLNMTSDYSDVDWIATHCGDRHYFVCSKRIGELEYENISNGIISQTYPAINYWTITKDESECFTYFTTVFKTFALIHDLESSICTVYFAAITDSPFSFQVRNSTSHNVILIKNMTNPVSLLYPGLSYNGTDAGNEYLPCNITLQTTTETNVETTSTNNNLQPNNTEVYTGYCQDNNTKCYCSVFLNLTKEQLSEKVVQLKKDLAVDKDMLSSHKRKFISVPDDRTSSKVMGVAGAIMITSFLMTIIGLDLRNIWTCISKVKRKK